MRRLRLPRRRKRNRVARTADQIAVRAGAALWLVRLLVRGRLAR